MREPEYEQRLLLWERDGDLAGFAEWNPVDASLDIQVHPRYAEGALAASMLGWAEQQAGDRGVTSVALDADIVYRSVLAERGYEERLGNIHYLYRTLSDEPLEKPIVPAGYEVRSLRGSEEAAARALGHRRGWESTKLTEEKYRRLMETPAYRSDFDVAVVTSDGEFVATANLWMDANGTAIVEPFSTAPEHRRKGLGRALMLFGIERVRLAGAHDAWVGSSVSNVASNGLYESVGFRVARRDVDYVKSN